METTLDYDRETGRVIWPRAAFEALGEAGFLDDGRYELLEGEIVRTVANEIHNYVCLEVFHALLAVYGREFVRMEGSLIANQWSEPVPDLTVTTIPRVELVRSGKPTGAQIRLVVEVSDTSCLRDRVQKARIYATAGVPEYWVVDINERTVLVHRTPSGDTYTQVETWGENDSLPLPSAPPGTKPLVIAQLLPPA